MTAGGGGQLALELPGLRAAPPLPRQSFGNKGLTRRPGGRLAQLDLVVDLGQRIGSRDWFRGLLTCGALCYGELSARYPEAGGGYVYLREAYGPAVAFMYGWMAFLVMDPGLTAALATRLATYAAYILKL